MPWRLRRSSGTASQGRLASILAHLFLAVLAFPQEHVVGATHQSDVVRSVVPAAAVGAIVVMELQSLAGLAPFSRFVHEATAAAVAFEHGASDWGWNVP